MDIMVSSTAITGILQDIVVDQVELSLHATIMCIVDRALVTACIAVLTSPIAAEITEVQSLIADLRLPDVARACIVDTACIVDRGDLKDRRRWLLIAVRTEALVSQADLVVVRWDRQWLSFHQLA